MKTTHDDPWLANLRDQDPVKPRLVVRYRVPKALGLRRDEICVSAEGGDVPKTWAQIYRHLDRWCREHNVPRDQVRRLGWEVVWASRYP